MTRGLIAILTASFMLPIPEAGACTCINVRQFKRAWVLEKYDAVFTGQVVSLHLPNDERVAGWRNSNFVEVGLEVRSCWKGEVGETVTIRTSSTTGACGIRFKLGRAYLICAKVVRCGWLYTNSCSKTGQFGEVVREWITELGDPALVYRSNE